jgi:hypothetical protein
MIPTLGSEGCRGLGSSVRPLEHVVGLTGGREGITNFEMDCPASSYSLACPRVAAAYPNPQGEERACRPAWRRQSRRLSVPGGCDELARSGRHFDGRGAVAGGEMVPAGEAGHAGGVADHSGGDDRAAPEDLGDRGARRLDHHGQPLLRVAHLGVDAAQVFSRSARSARYQCGPRSGPTVALECPGQYGEMQGSCQGRSARTAWSQRDNRDLRRSTGTLTRKRSQVQILYRPPGQGHIVVLTCFTQEPDGRLGSRPCPRLLPRRQAQAPHSPRPHQDRGP